MKIETIQGHGLTPDLCGIWAALQRVNDDLVSPFFHPEFTRKDVVQGIQSSLPLLSYWGVMPKVRANRSW